MQNQLKGETTVYKRQKNKENELDHFFESQSIELKTTRNTRCPRMDQRQNLFLTRTMIGNPSIVKDVANIRAERMAQNKQSITHGPVRNSPPKSHTKKSYSVSSFGANAMKFGKKDRNNKSTEKDLSEQEYYKLCNKIVQRVCQNKFQQWQMDRQVF